MKILILLSLLPIICSGQSSDTGRYSLAKVIKVTRHQSKTITAGTEKLISDVTGQYQGEAQQKELILLYKSIFDYQVVDKKVLKNLIDSLCTFGMNESVRKTAVETRSFIENRFLGKKIRDFELENKAGEIVKMSSLNKKYVVIELWASWCGPCLEQMSKVPLLRDINKDVEFYSISLDKTSDKMKQFLEKKGYDWPIVYGGYEDTNKELWSYLHIVSVPKYYTIDKDLIVIDVADKLDEKYVASLK